MGGGKFLNLGLISHPLNWVTLTLWLFFLGIILHSAHDMIVPAAVVNQKVNAQ
jgi:hypothetical protein